jgi:hypothetical protein
MGFDIENSHYILDAGFATQRCDPIPRGGMSLVAEPRVSSGTLGLVLHWLNSTMSEVSLIDMFGMTTNGGLDKGQASRVVFSSGPTLDALFTSKS